MFFQFKKDKKLIHKVQDKSISFLNKVIKFVKKDEKEGHIDLLQEYKKMNPEEISEIVSKIYTNKKEEKIKLFEFYKDDLISNGYKDYIYELLEEEIKYPGLIDCLIKSKKLKKILVKNTYDKKYKPCYIRKGNRWYLNEILRKIVESS
jgi:hypothetical protein